MLSSAFFIAIGFHVATRDGDEFSDITTELVARWVYADTPDSIERVCAKGKALFPAFEEILSENSKYPTETISRTFSMLTDMKCDRSQFIPIAIRRLGDDNRSVRTSILWFIEDAGGNDEIGVLSVLLLDKYTEIRFAAARVIAKRGGKRELAVFDLILKNANRYEQDGKLILSNFDIERFEECRDELKARHEKEKEVKDKPKAPPPEKK